MGLGRKGKLFGREIWQGNMAGKEGDMLSGQEFVVRAGWQGKGKG